MRVSRLGVFRPATRGCVFGSVAVFFQRFVFGSFGSWVAGNVVGKGVQELGLRDLRVRVRGKTLWGSGCVLVSANHDPLHSQIHKL